MTRHTETHGHCRLLESQRTWEADSVTLLQQGVENQGRIGKNEWWWFRSENLGGNNKRKGWARECKISLRLLTILECEFRESPIDGNSPVKEMKWEGMSNERPLGNRFSKSGEVGQRKNCS